MCRIYLNLCFLLLFAASASSQGIITTVAGNGEYGYNGDGVSATSARLAHPMGVAVDEAGNIYIADYQNHRVRKLGSSTGLISTIAGNGVAGYNGDEILATSANLNYPFKFAVASSGSLYISDRANDRIRKVNAAGVITTVAYGPRAWWRFSVGGWKLGVAVDNSERVFYSDFRTLSLHWFNHMVKVFEGSATYPVAGLSCPETSLPWTCEGGFNGDGIDALNAKLSVPFGLVVDGTGNIFIADTASQRIRRVDAVTHLISTVAGTGTAGYNGDGMLATAAQLHYPCDVAVDASGSLFIADTSNNRIRRVDVTTGIITTVAGTGAQGYNGDNVEATSAMLSGPYAVAVDAQGNIYIADAYNNRIRKVTYNRRRWRMPGRTKQWSA